MPVHVNLKRRGFYNHKSLFCDPVFCLTIILISITVSLAPRDAIAADITGTFTGTFSGTENCSPPESNPIISGSITLNITQSGSSFTGSGSVVDNDDGDTHSIQNLSGIIDTAGNVSGSFDVPDPPLNVTAVTFSGTLSGNTLTISGTWIDSGPPSCNGTISATLTRTGADVIVDPEITPSSVLTAPLLLNTQVKAITGDLNARIGDVLRGIATGPRQTASGFMWQGQTGLNAGDRIVNYGAWGSYSYSDFENDFVSTAFDGHRHNVLAGFDIIPWENTVFGVAVGYENSDIDTGFNRGNQETDGYTIAPYFGYLLTDTWSVDTSVGYSRVSSDQFRTEPVTDIRITSSPDADRWFGTLNVNGFTNWNNWLISGRIGLLHAKNIQESFTESNGNFVPEFTSELGQWNAGGEAAYSYGEFEPFIRGTYERDFSMTEIGVIGGPQPSNDNDNFLFGAGLRYFRANGLSANLEWNKRLGREDFDEDTITATVRWDF